MLVCGEVLQAWAVALSCVDHHQACRPRSYQQLPTGARNVKGARAHRATERGADVESPCGLCLGALLQDSELKASGLGLTSVSVYTWKLETLSHFQDGGKGHMLQDLLFNRACPCFTR